MLEGLIGGLFNGISIGAVLLIVALGLAIVFGLMGVINLAHGELMMFGAYTTFVVQNAAKGIGGIAPEIYIFVALPLAFLVAAAVGLLLERTVIRYLYGRPLETLLATWGVSLIMIQFVRSVSWPMVIGLVIFSVLFLGGRWVLTRYTDWERVSQWANPILLGLSAAIALVAGFVINNAGSAEFVRPWFGARNVDVTPPTWLRGGISLGTTLQFPYARLFIIALTILCLVAVYWFLNGTTWGLRIRSVTQNRSMSACFGNSHRTGGCPHLCPGVGPGGHCRMCRDPAGFRRAEPGGQLHCGRLYGGSGRRGWQVGRQHRCCPGDWHRYLSGGVWHHRVDSATDGGFPALDRLFHLLCHNQHGEGDGVCVDYCVFYRSDLPVCSRRKGRSVEL